MPKPTCWPSETGRVIEGVGEGVGGRDVAPISAELIAGIVGLTAVVVGESGLCVVEDGDGGEGLAIIAEGRAIDGSGIGRGVDPGLEDGSGGALGRGVVVLRVGVVAAADKGENLAGVRVQGDESDLRNGGRFAWFAVALRDDLVDVFHAEFHGIGGSVLEVGVERGVDAQGGVGLLLIGKTL